MNCNELTLEQAQAWFEALPPALRLVSLSPRFAAADAWRQPGLRLACLGVEQGAHRWLHCVHLRPLGGPGSLGAISPYGYGGPLSGAEEPEFLSAAWAAYQSWCTANGVLAEFCRFHPEARNERFFGGSVTLNRQTVSVDLLAGEPAGQYSTLARRKLKRAGAVGARSRFSRAADDWAAFAVFYRRAMTVMGAAPEYLFADAYFEALARLPQAWLCVCENASGWLSAGVYLYGGEVVEYHLGASAADGHAAGTAYLMQHAAALRGKSLGARSLYLGGGTGPEADNTLLFYKKSFSRRLLPFHIGQAIHDERNYWLLAARAGYGPANPPPRILLD